MRARSAITRCRVLLTVTSAGVATGLVGMANPFISRAREQCDSERRRLAWRNLFCASGVAPRFVSHVTV
jgi:hypothetical protein